MSRVWPHQWAIEAEVPNPGAKFVLVILCNHATTADGSAWMCFPSVERIAKQTAQGESTVRKHLDWLEAEGWITRKRKRREDGKLGVWVYTIQQDRGADDHRSNRDQPPLDLSKATAQIERTELSKGTIGSDANASSPPVGPDGPTVAAAKEPWLKDEWFGRLWAAAPDKMRTRSKSKAKVWTAWKTAIGLMPPEQIVAALVRYLKHDPDVARTGGPGLTIWLKDRTFDLWGPPGEAGAGEPERKVFPNADARALFVARYGEDAARSYLDPAELEGRVVRPATAYAKGWLDATHEWLRETGLTIGPCKTT